MEGHGIYSTEVENEDNVIIHNLKRSAKEMPDKIEKIKIRGLRWLFKPLENVFHVRKMRFLI